MSERVAIVHEWVSSRAGSEKVFEALAKMYPEADLYALSHEPGVEMDFGGRKAKTTFLDNATFRNRRGITLPIMPIAWQFVGQHKYDLVITSHHAFAASNRLAKRDGRHLAYVHTPARYVWTPELDGRGTSPVLKPIRAVLKGIDRSYVPRLTSIASNSQVVADRIGQFWNRDAQVIPPAVETDFFSADTPDTNDLDLPENFLLGFGRWIPYKNFDKVIATAEAANMPAVIAGKGPEKERLQELASKASVTVKIVEFPSDEGVRELYRRAAALVFPTFEDFGIVPVEAMASGTPVLALNKGGAAETVIDGKTGALVDSESVAAFVEALPRALQADAKDCRVRAEEFSASAFEESVRAWVKSSSK